MPFAKGHKVQPGKGPRRIKKLRPAINAMCKHCIFDPHGGGGSWREQVEACTSPGCPLFTVRPTTKTGRGGVAPTLTPLPSEAP